MRWRGAEGNAIVGGCCCEMSPDEQQMCLLDRGHNEPHGWDESPPARAYRDTAERMDRLEELSRVWSPTVPIDVEQMLRDA